MKLLLLIENSLKKNSTNTVKVIDADQISRLPVRGVTNIASLQSGVVIFWKEAAGQEGNATINVRGGRGRRSFIHRRWCTAK